MKKITEIDKKNLGECCGIFAGDGSLYSTVRSYVLEVRGNKNELSYYTDHVRPIFENIFSKKLKIIKRKYNGGYVIGVRVCGLDAKKLFSDVLGFPVGKKSETVEIPRLIIKDSECWPHYVRGIFDTDGSVYLRKTYKKYRNPVIDISSRSISHLLQIKKILSNIGFNFWIEKSNFKIRLAGWKNMERFFKEIRPHNNTKTRKFKEMMLGWPSG